MATFLTTRRMTPELAARVEASVRGRRAARSVRRRSLSVAALRFAAVLAFAAVVVGFAVAERRERARFAAAQAELLSRVRLAAASLGAAEKSAPARVTSWLARCSGPYAGDSIADEVRGADALDAALRRSIVYVRGPVASFRLPTGVQQASAASFVDAFASCLVAPPALRTEKSVLASVRGAHVRAAGRERAGAVVARAPIARFHHALQGIPFLLPDWESHVHAAGSTRELDALARAFERAPLERARLAARAELLLFAMDEPSDVSGPAELDGERPHPVRIGLVDLVAGRMLVQLRRRVDPTWLSHEARAEHASALDSCALAYDVRREVGGSQEGG